VVTSTTDKTTEYWMIELTLDHADRTFVARRIALEKKYPYTPPFYVLVKAQDEIGAYNEAQKILTRLGFRGGEVD
jgi:hypothetical protein